ncbi:hypothetical protein [Lachnoclostridium phytofermentans]|uniref:hypothetical protein n=1 Tax=Lachnoclostridium phytofermentans TaxID=66219 RepID=UPI000497C930|nr:hypothetical protein [Lachnoclostridium phytofermentans]
MLLTLRDEKNNLVVKDMLDINFDMKVENVKDKYCVRINRRYKFAEEYFSREEAEEQMLILANARNNIEQELRDF